MLTFPAILKPSANAGGFAPFLKSLSGGQAISGTEQVTGQMVDRWQASYQIPIRTPDAVLALRAFLLSMRGRLNTVALPAIDGGRAPWEVDRFGRRQTPGHARDRFKSLDGTAFAAPAGLADTLITAKVAAAASAIDTELTIAMVKGSAPQPGHLFSIGPRLYAIESVAGDGPYDLTIWPWLREDVAISAAVNFTSPVCKMRFQTDNEGIETLKSLNLFRFGTVTLNFDEAA
ncbi:hypothetical protein [Tardiphaga sp.]|uniref:hypothetical protein n=1 Tax=Tardiphaga sp. TaxID=1926292 RepID=UPI002611447B|nr:hypothetical protein [Tardiphaga sp.]MDB5620764.1 hypothetical protein [Tardiphaga sp.]